jgi:hypothetical protein
MPSTRRAIFISQKVPGTRWLLRKDGRVFRAFLLEKELLSASRK